MPSFGYRHKKEIVSPLRLFGIGSSSERERPHFRLSTLWSSKARSSGSVNGSIEPQPQGPANEAAEEQCQNSSNEDTVQSAQNQSNGGISRQFQVPNYEGSTQQPQSLANGPIEEQSQNPVMEVIFGSMKFS
ncbi:hypothetical protein K469DRAFT_176129 [Zopfia rhizophila CBS 207.26]|uniref:Uncharacterized protein n=1 Tax=Zopfia rhizophila CBS 207.26 TaxID=1314779 RepID=A0A6A6E1H1_9PEZI|nr:hypothetical protein K469DRAFT_176129 [Zopfia rhizophila CBS 207.26]